jgi:hypothetical protein
VAVTPAEGDHPQDRSTGPTAADTIGAMTTREKLIDIIQGMSEAELEAEYAHLRRAAGRPADGEDFFEDALEALAGISRRVDVSTDATRLVREERDRLAGRVR